MDIVREELGAQLPGMQRALDILLCASQIPTREQGVASGVTSVLEASGSTSRVQSGEAVSWAGLPHPFQSHHLGFQFSP